MASISEQTPLLHSTSTCSSTSNRSGRRSYRAKLFPRSCGAMLVLVCIVMIQILDPGITYSLSKFSNDINGQNVLDILLPSLLFLLYLIFPVVGLFADVKFGRHNVGKTALAVSIFASLLIIIGEVMKVKGAFAVFSTGFIVHDLATTSFYIVMLSYGLDQLIGASADELSAFIHWYYWCYILGWVLTALLTCSVQCVKYSVFILYSTHTGSLISALFIMFICKARFSSEACQLNANPVVLIAKVLKFAKKHKYPINRSALTYWEKSIPSRLDLGKEKYGGPFGEGEVEDVKTLFRIIPLIFVMVFFYITVELFNPYLLAQDAHNHDNFGTCLLSSTYFTNCTTILVVMLLYQLLLRNMCHRYMPTMLRRIAIGIVILILSEVAWLVIDYVGQQKANSTVCLFNNYGFNSSSTSDGDHVWGISPSWMIIPKVLMGLGYGITLPTTLEFTYAQSPFAMRGLVIGIWFMATGVMRTIGFNLYYPFKYFLSNAKPSCTFYYYVTKSLALVVFLVIYIVLAYCYQLRTREHHYHPHMAIEQFYEKDFERRDAHARQQRGSHDYDVEEEEKDIHAYLNSLHLSSSGNSTQA